MTEIIAGKLVKTDVTENAMGGTELIAERMVKTLPQELLKKFHIVHSRTRNLDMNDDLKKVLVVHDLPNDPELKDISNPEWRKQWDSIVFVSYWQQNGFNITNGVPFSESSVILNGIVPFEYHEKPDLKKRINLIYHTTPHRGLEILYPAVDIISKNLPEGIDIHLDVFSSFNAYGWPEKDKEYEKLFELIDEHPKMTNHGFKDNKIVRDYLKKAHIFGYPCIWPETSCLSAIEAQAAGCIVVFPGFCALPETLGQYGLCYNWNENRTEHANIFTNNLFATINHIYLNGFDYSGAAAYSNHVNNWNVISKEWESHLIKLLK